MTIHVLRMESPVGPIGRELLELEGHWTARQVLEHACASPESFAVLLAGRKLEGLELEQTLEDGAHLVVAPELHGVEFFIYAVLQVVLTAAQYHAAKIGDSPPAPNLDDESSPTYLLDGVSTRRGPGFPIPVVYGEHRCGGQVLASRADETVYVPRGQTNQLAIEDWLHLLIAYSEGPIHSIGDVDAGPCGEINDLGFRIGQLLYGNANLPQRDLPSGLKVNGTLIEADPDQTIALAHLRMGTLHQSPVRGPIRKASTLYSVDEELTQGNPVIYESIGEVDAIEMKLQFPAGLYSLSGSAMQPYRVDFAIRFRAVGDTTPWKQITPWGTNIQFPVGTRAAVSKTLRWDAWTRGSYQVQIERLTPDDNQSSTSSPSSRCVWRSATEISENDFAYPMLALMGLSLAGSERVSGTISTVTVPVKGRTLARYDGTQWLDEEWDDGAGQHHGQEPRLDPRRPLDQHALWRGPPDQPQAARRRELQGARGLLRRACRRRQQRARAAAPVRRRLRLAEQRLGGGAARGAQLPGVGDAVGQSGARRLRSRAQPRAALHERVDPRLLDELHRQDAGPHRLRRAHRQRRA